MILKEVTIRIHRLVKMQRRVKMQRNVSERVKNPTFTVSLTLPLFTDHNGGHFKALVMYYEFFSIILSRISKVEILFLES